MIDKKELRDGNYVLTPVFMEMRPITIKDIFQGFNSDVDPIPLTEEILLKCGCKKSKSENLLFYIMNGNMLYEISFRHSRWWLLRNCEVVTCFEFLHEFQNIWYWITKNELEVKL